LNYCAFPGSGKVANRNELPICDQSLSE
jgi:hypothetical protein